MKSIFKIFPLFLILFFLKLEGQEYDRTWGTYMGPAGTSIGPHFSSMQVNFDDMQNVNIIGQVVTNNNFNAAYYNQFATTSTGYDVNEPFNYIWSKISPSGNFLTLNYDKVDDFMMPSYSSDNSGSRFGLRYNITGLQGNGTPGTWFSSSAGSDTQGKLIKYDANSAVQWETFLPSKSQNIIVRHDDSGNTYIAAQTLLQNNFTTAGVLQENFEVLYNNDGSLKPNAYIAKLNSSGALIWATYFPSLAFEMRFHDGSLYILGGSDLNPNGSGMASGNAFQTQKALSSITRIDANTGNRIWGTYYGPSVPTVFQSSLSMIVNDTGIYVTGDIVDYSGNSNTYFGTSGSHQPTQAGSMSTDVYISKFSHNGNRVWSTYFGGPGEEFCSFSLSTIVSLGSDIIITLVQNSNNNTNLATPGAYIATMPTSAYPNGSNNLMFAKFNPDGVLQWASYYGGPSINIALNPTISVASPNPDTFYLYGSTLADTGIATPGAAQTAKLQNERTGFIARFDSRAELSNSEVNLSKDLVLYNNPNSGNFHLAGSVLQKLQCYLKIYDASGRVAFQQKLTKDSRQIFNLEHQLTKGHYFLEVSSESNGKINTFKMIVK